MGFWHHRHHHRSERLRLEDAPLMTAESALDEEAEEAQPILHRKRHRNLGQRLLKALFVVAGSMVVILAFFTVALLLLYLFMNAFTSSPLK